jgi:hypothetical protein
MENQRVGSANKPNVDPRWFWDFDYNKIDWQKSHKTVIARILERGGKSEWQELILFYGKQKVLTAIQNEIVFLPDYTIEEVCAYFNLKKETLLCYIRKQSKPGHWI